MSSEFRNKVIKDLIANKVIVDDNSSDSELSDLLCVGFTKEQDDTINNAVFKWSLDKSVTRASEELLELSLALLHYARGRNNTDNVLEEMADVRIALRHLEFKFGSYQKQINEKVKKCDT